MSINRNVKWEIYQDSRHEWRWRKISPNGRIIDNSSQGYIYYMDCVEDAQKKGYLIAQIIGADID